MAQAIQSHIISSEETKQWRIGQLVFDHQYADMLPFGMSAGQRKEECREKLRALGVDTRGRAI